MMRIYAITAFIVVSAAGICPAQDDLTDFWRRGHVRELLTAGINDVTLEEWAASGVNCTMAWDPTKAHAAGLRVRGWFTMNSIRPKTFGNDLDLIKSMCAVNRDGSYRRPYDPLFPSVADNWSACVNNPGWREYAAGVFRDMAERGLDGCHIDYASHYEPCYCQHCRAAWRKYAREHGLAATDLLNFPDTFQYKMYEREFRIRSVMDFLGMCRDEARKIKPGFGTDGTWHQDSGSAYQWAYGDHFDMMCIEGTTWGPFPPRSQQIVWLKLAHALSHGQVAMSVTYHLISENGKRHHGRMAADRTELALCEIMSQGGVSWLGLGGPGTGNLLREHADMVKQVYATWAALEPQLTSRTDVGEVGIVFSPRSFLVSGASRKQLYAIGQTLMKEHIPFVIHSDVGLTAEKLATCPATVLLDAQALTPEATQALERYVADGGRLLVLGEQPKYAPDWSELEDVPALLGKPDGKPGLAEKTWQGHPVWYVLGDALKGVSLGAAQNVMVNQQQPAPLAIEGESKALDVSGRADGGYSLYVDITYQDGSNLWGQVATFATGTHDWEFSRFIIEPAKPVKSANVHLLFRGHDGTAWFRKVRFGPWDGEKITENLLGDGLNPGGDKVYTAEPGQDAAKGVWRPYGGGFEVEEIAGEGPTVKVSTGADAVRVCEMHQPDPQAVAAVMRFLEPILPTDHMLTVEGEGASQVYCDVSKWSGGWLLQLLNYNAELHPELPEMEQQQADHTIPVENLRVTFNPPGGGTLGTLTLKVPGEKDVTPAADGNTFTIARLEQYAAVVAARAQ
ncbi:MAG: hypothetical protein J7M38_13830 [Armatimonadetes bacterium]|nr:hypothetical protein [Armatimonadota bacterium]